MTSWLADASHDSILGTLKHLLLIDICLGLVPLAVHFSKILPIPGTNIDLNISEDVTLYTTVHQRPMNAPQQQFMSKWIDQMHSTDLIEPADIPQIKHVVPTVLTQKTHEVSGSMSLEDLRRELNKQCEHTKLAQPFDEEVGASTTEQRAKKPPNEPLKWRVTQNFAELNKITQILPMFQGDSRAKQQRLSSHKYISVFNFASGFYAIQIPQKWHPYFTFFAENKGYWWYKQMAMGWTGAPTIFSATATRCLHNMLADDTLELFADDGGCADNSFEEMLIKL